MPRMGIEPQTLASVGGPGIEPWILPPVDGTASRSQMACNLVRSATETKPKNLAQVAVVVDRTQLATQVGRTLLVSAVYS